MFCWCLNLRNGTNNEYSQLLFIYQITPDSFTIDKSEYDVMHMEHREKGQASNIPSRHRRGTGDIILDYTGFGFFFLFLWFASAPSRSRPLNANSSMSRKAGERSENQINRVYYVIVFHSRTFIQKVTFRWGQWWRKSFFSLPLHPLRSLAFTIAPSTRLRVTVQRLSYWFSLRP